MFNDIKNFLTNHEIKISCTKSFSKATYLAVPILERK